MRWLWEKDITFYSTCEHHLPAILRKSTYRIYPGWKSRRTEQACKNSRSICKKTAASGAVDGQIADALMEHMQAKGAIVMIEAEHMCNDYAWNQAAGKPDSDAGEDVESSRQTRHWKNDFSAFGEIAMLMEKYIEMTRLNAVWNHPLYQKYYRGK